MSIIHTLFQVYTVLLFVRILSSWIPELYRYRFMHFVMYYTDPYLNFFRGIIPPLGMIDISPIFAFLALQFMEFLIMLLLNGMMR